MIGKISFLRVLGPLLLFGASLTMPLALRAQTAPANPSGPVSPATAAGAAPTGASAAGAATSAALAAGISGSSYQVAPEDVVTVKVFREDDLLTTTRVSKEGLINFPLIGNIRIGGKSPDDAARAIAAELGKQYIINPQVSLTVIEYSLRRYTVLGEVQKPGSYNMPDRGTVTLLEAIGAAGGYTRIADPANIRLKRLSPDGKETVFKLNAKSMASERDTVSFEIKVGDIITVGQSFF